MDIIITFLGYLLSCIIIFYVVFDYMNKMYERKYHKRTYIAAYTGCVIFLTGINMLNHPELNLIASFLLIFGIGNVLYTSNSKWYILYNTIFIIVTSLLETFAIISIELIYILIGFNLSQTILIDFLNIAVSRILMIIVYRIIITYFRRRDIKDLDRSQALVYFILPLYSVLIIHAFMVLTDNISSSFENILVLISIVGIVIVNLLVIQILEHLSASNHMKSRIKLFEQQSAMQYRYYENIEKKYNQSRKILHDMKNHIQTLESMHRIASDSNGMEYTRKLISMIDELGYRIYTRNRILNIILNDKVQLANQLGIRFTCMIDDVDMSFVSDFDMTTIFGNLLDNSIEACKELDDDRLIEVKVRQFNNFIVVNIANTAREKPLIVDGKIISGKKDHSGIGLSNVRNTVEKYYGDLNIYYEDNRFEANISLTSK